MIKTKKISKNISIFNQSLAVSQVKVRRGFFCHKSTDGPKNIAFNHFSWNFSNHSLGRLAFENTFLILVNRLLRKKIVINTKFFGPSVLNFN